MPSRKNPADVSRFLTIAQLLCVIGAVAVAGLGWTRGGVNPVALLTLVVLSAALTLYGAWSMTAERRSTRELARSVEVERELSATLEQAVAARTEQFEDAQR